MGRTGQLGPKAQSILQSAGVCGDARLHSSMQPVRRHSVKFRLRPCVSSQTCLSAEFARTELNAQRRAMRLAAKPQPEVHIIGEICGGTGFGEGTSVCCKWALEAGDRWEQLEGAKGGQTQTDTPESGTDVLVWSHPIDAHFVAGSMQVCSEGRSNAIVLVGDSNCRLWSMPCLRADSSSCWTAIIPEMALCHRPALINARDRCLRILAGLAPPPVSMLAVRFVRAIGG